MLDDGTYLSALIAPTVRGARRERLLAAARAGEDLADINAVPDAFYQCGLPVIHQARVIEYDIGDRVGNCLLLVLARRPARPASISSPLPRGVRGPGRSDLTTDDTCVCAGCREVGDVIVELGRPARRGP